MEECEGDKAKRSEERAMSETATGSGMELPTGIQVQAHCPDPSASSLPQAASAPLPPPRVLFADRQTIIPAITLDQLLDSDHPARDVWLFVQRLDLQSLYDAIGSREGSAGRPANDPRVLVALWLYAFLCGFTSARALVDLCSNHNAFRWLAGGLSFNHHSLSNFLVGNIDMLQRIFDHSVDVLRKEGLVDLERIAQDGMRVRACAGAASFRRRPTLEKLLEQARQDLQALKQRLARSDEDEKPEPPHSKGLAEEDTGGIAQAKTQSTQESAACMRAAQERLERVQEALERMPEMEAKKDPTEKHKARVSTTDPEASVMKMADGGFRPAYNFQYSTTTENMIIVGVDVTREGTDQGQLPPMLDQVEKRHQKRPKEVLVDGGFANHQDIEAVQSGAEGKGKCTVYAPVPKPKKEGVDRYAPHEGDSTEVAEWRKRMGTDEAKEIYKERGQTAECVNAQARNRGLIRLFVRGLEKVKAISLWLAIVHNMARGFDLLPRPQPT